ncbi:uncharacterized protein HRG_08572 [Hirsutella rhossiliensis]|uniref:Chromo domain-containing protein n=1 Tax=Hirsutella rhossiliensis TaxID=111463 RepID=A0A9P8MWF4_9HYPO|nr:uncharacterized protein HRG_08572 [Hirsutella rhossiliensis]KAH0960417.1 hypothetical protein HRG_08572 [Hirsutella rhossiliensis]
MKIHRVINASRLLKAPSDPVPGQTYEPPPPVVIQGESEWEIDQVLASRIARGKLQYQVSWKGWDPDPDWYLASNFKNAPLALQHFHNAHPDKPGPPGRLAAWIQAAATDQVALDTPDDDLPTQRQDNTKMRRRRVTK